MKTRTMFFASLKIWIVIYPSITVFLYILGDMLSGFPLHIRTLVLTLVLVPWILFAGIPFVDFILKVFSSEKGNK